MVKAVADSVLLWVEKPADWSLDVCKMNEGVTELILCTEEKAYVSKPMYDFNSWKKWGFENGTKHDTSLLQPYICGDLWFSQCFILTCSVDRTIQLSVGAFSCDPPKKTVEQRNSVSLLSLQQSLVSTQPPGRSATQHLDQLMKDTSFSRAGALWLSLFLQSHLLPFWVSF